jgi:integrase
LFIRDDQLKRFALRVTASGVKSFIWEGRIKGRPRRVTLGQYPDLKVLDARTKALDTKRAVAHGANPAEERAQERAEITFANLEKEYLERHAKQRKLSWREDEALLKNHLPKGWRTRRLSDITRQDVINLRDVVARKENPRVKDKEARKKGVPYAANHLVRLLRAMFNLAKDWGMMTGDNPATRIKLFPERKRDRFLSPDESGRVNQALAQEPNEYWRAYFALSLMLGTRKSELLGVRWIDIDFKQRTLRISRTKSGRPHVIPLPTATISILESLSSRETSEWAFPSDNSKSGHLASPKQVWAKIRKVAGVPDVHVHDLRRTLGSWLAASGYSLPLIGRALNHSNVSTTAIYARLNLDPVRQALEQNATLMLSARSEQEQDDGNNGTDVDAAPGETEKDPTAFLRKLPNGWIQLTREELYKQVWSRPILSIAKEFGISDRGLGKICERFEIPAPPRGYWAKHAAGIRTPKSPLPPHQSKVPVKIQIRPSASATSI